MIQPKPGDCLTCTMCGAPLGTLVEMPLNGHPALYLEAGGFLLRYGHGVCASCKRNQHFDAKDFIFNRLIRAIISQIE